MPKGVSVTWVRSEYDFVNFIGLLQLILAIEGSLLIFVSVAVEMPPK